MGRSGDSNVGVTSSRRARSCAFGGARGRGYREVARGRAERPEPPIHGARDTLSAAPYRERAVVTVTIAGAAAVSSRITDPAQTHVRPGAHGHEVVGAQGSTACLD